MLPIILQHVRELAEVHVAAAERDRYKIITPFPPSGPDFRDFAEDELTFGDPPPDGDSASLDTVRAFEFFNRANDLYYDYSYGIRSEEYRLSDACETFFRNARAVDGDGAAFSASFAQRRDAFLNRYKRSTIGDLGNFDFRYTLPSPVSWNAERIVLGPAEVDRLKTKAVAVYEDLELEDVGFVSALLDEIRSANYASVAYDFGFFDVIREWMDPRLFESRGWTFGSASRTLYGQSDPFFINNDVNLCYAQRFYVIRKYAATPAAAPVSPEPGGPHVRVRDHRFRLRAADVRPRVLEETGGDGGGGDGGPGGGVLVRAGIGRVRDHRRKLRNDLILRKVTRLERALTPLSPAQPAPADAPPPPRPGFVWVAATPAVPGHWERERAGAPSPPPPAAEPPVDTKPTYKIAAVKCRILPRTP